MIVTQIEAIVNQLVAAPLFAYGSVNELELFVDDLDFKRGLKPAVMMYTLKPATVSTTPSQAVNINFSIYMEFLYQTDFDQFTSQNESIITQASALMEEFLVKLEYYRETSIANRFFKIHLGEKAKMLPVYNKFSVNATGVSLSVTLNTMLNTGYNPFSRPVGYVGP